MSPTDWELVAQHIAGDKRALEEIVRRYTPRLRAHLTRYFRLFESDVRHATIEDILQEVWIRVDRFAIRLDPKRVFATWIFTVASNLACNEHRGRRLRPEERLPLRWRPEMGVLEEKDFPDMRSASRPDVGCENRDTIKKLAHYLNEHIARKYIEALELREVQGYSYAEIAHQLGIKDGTVRSRLHRARLAARQFRAENK